MIEAVGLEYWPAYFATIDRVLAPGGRVALQSITIEHQRLLATKGSYTWIHKYVFPGGIIPSLHAVRDVVAHNTLLRVSSATAYGHDYARTLHSWLERFHANTAAGSRARLRRALHPDVEVLPRLLRGRFRQRLPERAPTSARTLTIAESPCLDGFARGEALGADVEGCGLDDGVGGRWLVPVRGRACSTEPVAAESASGRSRPNRSSMRPLPRRCTSVAHRHQQSPHARVDRPWSSSPKSCGHACRGRPATDVRSLACRARRRHPRREADEAAATPGSSAAHSAARPPIE